MGFDPDFAPGTDQQLAALRLKAAPTPVDAIAIYGDFCGHPSTTTRRKIWIQIEVAERVSSGISRVGRDADVDSDVSAESPLTATAAKETVTVLHGGQKFSHASRSLIPPI